MWELELEFRVLLQHDITLMDATFYPSHAVALTTTRGHIFLEQTTHRIILRRTASTSHASKQKKALNVLSAVRSDTEVFSAFCFLGELNKWQSTLYMSVLITRSARK